MNKLSNEELNELVYAGLAAVGIVGITVALLFTGFAFGY